ncbi:SLC13 family permease [Orrella sp. 11846]|uniref:SLC13 family permease n=1 Tax=Orrella sp. 11846 TaxID=3409913 RepID=UPI003B59737C
MTLEIALVLAIAAVAMVLFITERLRMDIVAMLVLVSLSALDLISPTEALSGFSNQATITVAAMFILAAGLQNTGALNGVGKLLSKSRSPTTFLLLLFGLLALIAPFVNNTAVVAVFMPVVIAASLQIGLSPTKTLIPLSYVSQMIGVCTLIGTSTNLIVNAMAQDLGHKGFTMFEFLPLGAICALAGCFYLLTLGRWILPEQGLVDDSMFHESGHFVTEMRIPQNSALIGTSVEKSKLAQTYKVYVLELWRKDEKRWAPRAEKLKESDTLLIRGKWENLYRLKEEMGLCFKSEQEVDTEQPASPDVVWPQKPTQAVRQALEATSDPSTQEVDTKPSSTSGIPAAPKNKRVLAEVMISPNSRNIGQRLSVLDQRLSRDVSILGVQRRGQVLRESLQNTVLHLGDILLVLLPQSHVAQLRKNRDLILLSERDEPLGRGWRTPFSWVVMTLVVVLAALDWLPIAVSALAGAMVMVMTRCVETDDMYDAVDWRILFLMAGLLPLGIAMSNSGAAGFIVDNTVGLVSDFGPHVVLAVLYLMALLLGELMSNSAAAVLLTPIGISTAQYMGADATPFLVAITFSASTSFLTPVGYQTNTMVYGAGGYRFSDFIKVGLPLNLIFWVLGVIFIPMFWAF